MTFKEVKYLPISRFSRKWHRSFVQDLELSNYSMFKSPITSLPNFMSPANELIAIAAGSSQKFRPKTISIVSQMGSVFGIGISYSTFIRQIDTTISYYTNLAVDLIHNINYLQDEMYYDPCSEDVLNFKTKLAAVHKVVMAYTRLWENPHCAEDLKLVLLAEYELDQFGDLLPFAVESSFTFPIWSEPAKVRNIERLKAAKVTKTLAIRDRIIRFIHRKLLRDIRRHYRTIVPTLFKLFNDQSGIDEFAVMPIVAITHRIPSINPNCLLSENR